MWDKLDESDKLKRENELSSMASMPGLQPEENQCSKELNFYLLKVTAKG